jgi:UDP:flavonoid glycosyltransferase YjiC (YdhE family)
LDLQRLTATVIDALSLVWKRGVLATGGGALAAVATPAHVTIISEAPHDRLFPMMSGVIHHGALERPGLRFARDDRT